MPTDMTRRKERCRGRLLFVLQFRPSASLWVIPFIALLFIGCRSAESRFVGRWEAPGQSLDLKADGLGIWQWHGQPSHRVWWTLLNRDTALLDVRVSTIREQVEANRRGKRVAPNYFATVTLTSNSE